MKKNRLKLSTLKVQSFLTVQDAKATATIKGGLPRCEASAATFCAECDEQ